MDVNSKLKEYKFVSIKYNNKSSVVRQLFIKELIKNGEKSLILFNVPIFSDFETFKSFLQKHFGLVTKLSFHSSLVEIFNSDEIVDNHGSPFDNCRIAHVVFKKKSSFKKILNCEDTLNFFGKNLVLLSSFVIDFFFFLFSFTEEDVSFNCFAKFKDNYNKSILDPEQLRNEINNYLDKKRQAKLLAEKEAIAPDEDGFIKVVRKRRRSRI